MKFSVVMPIHNEEKFLPYSLPSLLRLEPNQIILLFDRCTDSSIQIARSILSRFRLNCDVEIVVENEECEWAYRPAYLFRKGATMSNNDTVLFTGADVIIDQIIKEKLNLLGKNGIALISFLEKEYPITLRNLLRRLLIRIGVSFPHHKEHWLAGLMAFSKKIWLETEDIESAKKAEWAQDTHLHKAILSEGYTSLCVVTNTVHLRPRESWEMHYLRGLSYWNVARRSFLITLLSSLFYVRLPLIKGYIHARYGGSHENKKVRRK